MRAARAGGTTTGMSYVAINVLTVPPGAGETLEQRFAARQGAVDAAPGFEHFELLRPVQGTDDYLVYTRWRSEADFTAWRESQAFGQGHAGASGRPAGAGPAATGSTIWAFQVVQQSDGSRSPEAASRQSAAQQDRLRGERPGGSEGQRGVCEEVPGVVSTDPGPRQAPGQGERAPEDDGTRPPEDPRGEPGFA